jgi:hypothetical protein
MVKVTHIDAGRIEELRRTDGSLLARGRFVDGRQHGYWEWFRGDGSVKRTGYFQSGKPISVWTEFDANGRTLRNAPADAFADLAHYIIDAPQA